MIEITWKDPEWVHVDSVEVIGKDDSEHTIPLMLQNGYWYAKFPIQNKMLYYRLRINNSFSIVNPLANMYGIDEKNEIWSICMENELGEQLYNSTQYHIEIEDCYMTDHVEEWHLRKKDNRFIPPSDKMVVTHLTINKGTGLHAITLLYINPKNELIDLCEEPINLDVLKEDKLQIWFQRDLKSGVKETLYGTWRVVLLIDGEFNREEYYQIDHSITYSLQI